jgi:hypothetical protein
LSKVEIVPARAYDRQRRTDGFAWVGVVCGPTASGYYAVRKDGTWGKRRRKYPKAYADAMSMDIDSFIARPIPV